MPMAIVWNWRRSRSRRTPPAYFYDATRWDPYVVGEDHVFVIGDNRNGSIDSREFGDVPLSRVVGTALN